MKKVMRVSRGLVEEEKKHGKTLGDEYNRIERLKEECAHMHKSTKTIR
jgi:hypothetical protein